MVREGEPLSRNLQKVGKGSKSVFSAEGIASAKVWRLELVSMERILTSHRGCHHPNSISLPRKAVLCSSDRV